MTVGAAEFFIWDKHMIKSDIGIGIALIILSAVFFINSFTITQSTITAPMADASFFPRVISVLLAVSSAFMIAKDVYRRKKLKAADSKTDSESADGEEKAEKITFRSEKFVLFMMAATVVYIYVIPRVGYLVTTIVFIFGCSMYLGTQSKQIKRKILVLPIAVVISLFAYVLFSSVLSVFLPRGFLI